MKRTESCAVVFLWTLAFGFLGFLLIWAFVPDDSVCKEGLLWLGIPLSLCIGATLGLLAISVEARR